MERIRVLEILYNNKKSYATNKLMFRCNKLTSFKAFVIKRRKK